LVEANYWLQPTRVSAAHGKRANTRPAPTSLPVIISSPLGETTTT